MRGSTVWGCEAHLAEICRHDASITFLTARHSVTYQGLHCIISKVLYSSRNGSLISKGVEENNKGTGGYSVSGSQDNMEEATGCRSP